MLSHAKGSVLLECLMCRLKPTINKGYNRADFILLNHIDAILFASLVI